MAPDKIGFGKEVGSPGEGALVGVEKLQEGVSSSGRDQGKKVKVLREIGDLEESERKNGVGESRHVVEGGQQERGKNSDEMLDSQVPMIWEKLEEGRTGKELINVQDDMGKGQSVVTEALSRVPLQDSTNRIDLVGNEKENGPKNCTKGK